ncbi:agmatine deiminase [Paenibacillus caui]|uniref:agmatine deiminase n=1 Tax=Paenibacillus caui TaxID=2873927 RepID=UPI001CA8F559|nr:agmatine deiminase [Paenibacillus caui]
MSYTINSRPKLDGFRMPAEFEPHEGTWMLWPTRTDTWRLGAKPAQDAFYAVALAISQFEAVNLGVLGSQYEHVRSIFPPEIRVIELSYNDAWMRDIGPTFVKNDQGEVRGIDWGFNAWGGLKGGLYFPWDQDLFVKQKVLDIERQSRYDASHFILEGGSFTVDGEGTLITTEQCLLNANRNPDMSREDIEGQLKDYLNVEKMIWLEQGMRDDETDGHVDEVAAFIRPGAVALSWTDDENDPQYPVLSSAYEVLKNAVDAKGRKLEIHKIHIPEQIVLSDEDARLIDRARQSYSRNSGTRLAATYVNFYICNGGVVMPAFGDPRDRESFEHIQCLFPERKVVQVNTREIAYGGGNIHCITQQQPKA